MMVVRAHSCDILRRDWNVCRERTPMSKLAPIAKSLSVVAGCMSAALFTSSALATERNASIPDFSGMWGRNAFDLEAPQAGPAPGVNIKRPPNGTGGPQGLVGDLHQPILQPEAA